MLSTLRPTWGPGYNDLRAVPHQHHSTAWARAAPSNAPLKPTYPAQLLPHTVQVVPADAQHKVQGHLSLHCLLESSQLVDPAEAPFEAVQLLGADLQSDHNICQHL